MSQENTADAPPIVTPVTPVTPDANPTPEKPAEAPKESGEPTDKGAPKQEPPKPVDPTPEQKRMAARFAAIKNRDREVSAKAQAVAAKEAALAEREAKIQAIVAEHERLSALKSKAKESPEEIYKEFGIDYNYLTQYHLNNGKRPEVDVVNEQIGSLKQEIETQKKNFEEIKAQQAAKEQERLMQEAMVVAQSYADKIDSIYGPETKYPFTKISNGRDIILEVARQKTEAGEPWPEPEEIAPVLEQFYKEQYQEALKNPEIAGIVKTLIEPEKPKEEEKEQNPLVEQLKAARNGKPTKTLTNAQVLVESRPTQRALTREERLEMAVKRMKEMK